MTDRSKLDYDSIEGTPAHELLQLTHEELDAFIAQAREIKAHAILISNWLTAIKFEKSIRENEEDSEWEVSDD